LGAEIISLNCCKWLQINRPFFLAVTDLPEGRKWIDWGAPGKARSGARDSSFILLRWREQPVQRLQVQIKAQGRDRTDKNLHLGAPLVLGAARAKLLLSRAPKEWRNLDVVEIWIDLPESYSAPLALQVDVAADVSSTPESSEAGK
jgi:hypothetical protein